MADSIWWSFDICSGTSTDVWCGEHKEGYRAYCHPDHFKPIAPLVYHNEGNGQFSEVSQKTGIRKTWQGSGHCASPTMIETDNRHLLSPMIPCSNFSYHNKGDGTFEEVGLLGKVAVDGDGRTFAGMGVDFADYNNDGLAGIVVTDSRQSDAMRSTKIPAMDLFTYATMPSGIGQMSELHSGWGMRFLDFDNDGWKDLLIAQGHDLDTD